METVLKAIDAVLGRGEFRYRVIASLAGIATYAAWRWDAANSPSEVVNAVATWAGVDLSDWIATFAAWI